MTLGCLYFELIFVITGCGKSTEEDHVMIAINVGWVDDDLRSAERRYSGRRIECSAKRGIRDAINRARASGRPRGDRVASGRIEEPHTPAESRILLERE